MHKMTSRLERIAESAAGSLTVVVLTALWSLLTRSRPAPLAVAVTVVIAVTVGAIVPKFLDWALRRRLEELAAATQTSPERPAHAGIVAVHANFNACEQEVLRLLGDSARADMLVQVGKSIVSGGRDFYDRLSEVPLGSGKRVRILHASLNSPYLNAQRAEIRSSSFSEWEAEISYAQNKITGLHVRSDGRVEGRQHAEPFLWRIFLFDDVAFVQPYLFAKQNNEHAPVLEIARCTAAGEPDPTSLYALFRKYFELLWEKWRPDRISLAEFIPRHDIATVASVVRSGAQFLFVIPRRYIERGDKIVHFHCVGGKIEPPEDYVGALQREAREEIGTALRLVHHDRTLLVSSYAEHPPLEIVDHPAPYALFKRERSQDKNFEGTDALWLIGFWSELEDELPLPCGETGALLFLSEDLLRQTLRENLTFHQLQRSQHAKLIFAEGLAFKPLERVAKPAGMAEFLAGSTLHRQWKSQPLIDIT